MKLGFIGLGHMGSAMAGNLVKAGREAYSIAAPEKAPRSSSWARMRRPPLPKRAAVRS